MKTTYYKCLCSFVLGAFLFSSCDENELPSDPVLTMPIGALCMEVSGEEYTAVPALDENAAFTGDLTLAVKVPSGVAKITSISLRHGYTCDLKVGDEVHFTDNCLDIPVYSAGNSVDTYTVVMQFNPPPFFYFVKTSDRDEQGDGYFLNEATQARIASANYDNYYEGEVDMTATNWDNVALVSQDLSTIYNVAAGPWPALSNYSWTAETKAAPGNGYFKSDGPWNDWLVTNGNEAIVSPGVWRVNFDSSTNVVDMTMTQWAVGGNAIDGLRPMVYDSVTRSWSVDATLRSGSLHFETIPVTFGDPRFYLGYKPDILGQLAADGKDISVEAGEYVISLTLSNPPYYTFSITKK